MKKLTLTSRLNLSTVALLLAVGGFFVANTAIAVISSTFTDVETVANLSAVNDQDAVTATTIANVPAGTDDQDATTATTQANVNTATATVTVDSSIAVTADTAGTAGNALSVEIIQSDADLGDT